MAVMVEWLCVVAHSLLRWVINRSCIWLLESRVTCCCLRPLGLSGSMRLSDADTDTDTDVDMMMSFVSDDDVDACNNNIRVVVGVQLAWSNSQVSRGTLILF